MYVKAGRHFLRPAFLSICELKLSGSFRPAFRADAAEHYISTYYFTAAFGLGHKLKLIKITKEDIIDPAAFFADEVLMHPDIRIKVVKTVSAVNLPYAAGFTEHLKIAVDRAEAYVFHIPADIFINYIGSGVVFPLGQEIIYSFALF